MSAPAYKVNDRRGTNTGWNYASGTANNSLYNAATQTNERKQIPNLNFDTHRTVSRVGHRQLRSVGRFIYSNFGPVHGALLEQAELSVGHFIPQFVGSNRDWGNKAEKWLKNWFGVMDMRGWPYDCTAYLRNLIVGVRRDGDHFTLLTENEDGYPMIQVIGPHRIGSYAEEPEVKGGPFDGYSIFNGVICNEYGRVVGYRIYEDSPVGSKYVDVSAADGFLLGFPEYCDQYRFYSSLGSCAFDWQDVAERRQFEMLAQKLGSSIALIEKNEAGEPMPGQGTISRPSATNTPASQTGIATESYEGGIIRYLKANSGASLESLRLDRPSADSQAFEAAIIRGAFKGMEWDVDFSLDPSKVGGASMRVVVEKINRTIEKNQALAEKAMRRICGWAVSKAIKSKLLPDNDEWWMWEFQGPGEVTADRKYDSDVDLQEIAQGVGTRKKACAKRGLFSDDVDAQRELEARSDLSRAQKLAKDFGITIQEALTVLRPPTPNGMVSAGGNQNQPDPKTEEK